MLPEFEVHKADKNLDKEQTMFDTLHNNDLGEEDAENDDFDDEDDTPALPVTKSKKAAVAPKGETKKLEGKTEKTELDGDDDDFIMAD